MSASSASDRAEPAPPEDDPAHGGLTRLAHRWAKPIAIVWLVACAWLANSLRSNGLVARGDLDGLTPVEHRARTDEPLLLLDAEDMSAPPTTAALLGAAMTVATTLADERVPIAAPRGDLEAWLDTHALYLLPLDAHDQLSERLSNEAMTAAVEDLRARLSSPLHGMMGDEVRRDPLRLGQMMRNRITRTGSGVPSGPSAVAEITAAGDLLAPTRDALLIGLRTSRPPEAILADVRAEVDIGIRASIVGPVQQREATRELVDEHRWPLALSVLCGLVILLGASLRAVRPVLTRVACVGSVVALVASMVPLDVMTLPMLAILAAFGCEGALRLQPIARHRWAAAAIASTALLPLWLAPYPAWRTWSWLWLVAILLLVLALQLVLPALRTIVRDGTIWPHRGAFVLRTTRVGALLVTVSTIGAGLWAFERLDYRGVDRIDLGEHVRSDSSRLREAFFDPSLVAEARSPGFDVSTAIEQSAIDAELLASLIPGEAVRIDSPGVAILLGPELEQKRAALARLELPKRMLDLRSALESRGFRADAFGEFLRGATDLDAMPTAVAAVQGSLGPWVTRFVEQAPEGVIVRSRVHLVPDHQAQVSDVVDEQGHRITLHGPVVAARADRQTFGNWLAIYAMLQIWLGALILWLSTRSLAIALSASFAALVSEAAVLTVMFMLNQPLGPPMVPAFVLVGAAAMIASGRACKAVELQRPVHGMSFLVASACHVVAALALIGTGVPVWGQIGLVVAAGSVVAAGTGLFVAPGLAGLLHRIGTRGVLR